MKTHIDITDPETGEVFQLRSDTLVGDIRDMFMARRRMDLQATTWGKLSQDQQMGEISAVTGLAYQLVNAIVEVVAQSGRPVIHAHLKKYGVKDGVVELTAAGLAEDDVVLSLNRVGKKVIKITVADVEQFDQSRGEIKADPDQPSLPLDVKFTPMSPDEETAIAADMDKALDDVDLSDAAETLDASDAEDLHVEAEDADETPDDLSPEQMGYNARINGGGIKDNPFHFDAVQDFTEWEAGFETAEEQIGKVRSAAILALEDNDPCPYKPGGFAATLWGNVQAAAQMAIEDDATKSGYLAAESGLPLDANPYEIAPHLTFWADGWLSWYKKAKKTA
jgi:hypothetical protein